jgi:hypothetical protein
MLEINADKSWIMMFGPVPMEMPTFTLNGSEVRYKDEFCYVGVTFQSNSRNIFAAHYTAKAQTARSCCFTVLGIEVRFRDLPPKQGRVLYVACVDPHLISGADVVVDVDPVALAELEKFKRPFYEGSWAWGPFPFARRYSQNWDYFLSATDG